VGLSNVSRETTARLEIYVALLLKWNQKINLISTSSEEVIWQRHIIDSIQLISHIPTEAKKIADLGSGAGLPGIILAIMMPQEFFLIERDQRKCAFLAEAVRECGIINVEIVNSDIVKIHQKFDVITARAMANLNELLGYVFPLIMERTICLFPKGESYAMELEEAKKHWDFSCQTLPSLTHKKSRILVISELRQRGG
jgi:16S rRNA (guanine527-N7)-methyltransferase